MRELLRPTGIVGHDDATELIRFWLAGGQPHLSLLLGMYEDAEDCDVDEFWAWGNILADIAQHVAHGMQKSHGYDNEDSLRSMTRYFNQAMLKRTHGIVGEYVDDA